MSEEYINRDDTLQAVWKRIQQIGDSTNPLVLSIRQAVREVPAANVVSLSSEVLSRLNRMSENMRMNRSSIIEEALVLYYRFFLQYGPDPNDWDDDDPHLPEIGNTRYPAYYKEEDL